MIRLFLEIEKTSSFKFLARNSLDHPEGIIHPGESGGLFPLETRLPERRLICTLLRSLVPSILATLMSGRYQEQVVWRDAASGQTLAESDSFEPLCGTGFSRPATAAASTSRLRGTSSFCRSCRR
jgi:hypothetical protein